MKEARQLTFPGGSNQDDDHLVPGPRGEGRLSGPAIIQSGRREKFSNGLQIPSLIALAGAGFYVAWTTRNASAHCVEAIQDDYIHVMEYASLGAESPIQIEFS